MAVKGGAGSAPPNGTVTGPNWSWAGHDSMTGRGAAYDRI